MTSNLVEIPRSVPPTEQDTSASNTLSSKEVSARILKKRESDRRCQRIKRERTKTKIAALEEKVRTFGNQDSSGQVQLLIQQLQDVEKERDNLAKKVKTIENVIRESEEFEREQNRPVRRHDPPGSAYAPSTADSLELDPTEPSVRSPNGEQQLGRFQPVPLNGIPSMPAAEAASLRYAASAPDAASTLPTGISESFVAEIDPSSTESSGPSVHPSDGRTCECCSVEIGRSERPRFNVWRFANDVLSSRFTWPAYCRLLTDEHREDTPVRAILEGWDTLEACGVLHPSWAILKKIDQTLLQHCDQKERMAVIIAIQLLLLSHTKEEPVPELPTYYRKRPSQNMADSYAIHFFPWPGMRERFVFNQHRYCTNEFWNAFIKGLRLTWSYEFRDTYTRNVETGLYAVSPLFQQHINNIGCWTMDVDVFQKWPELSADIPAYNRIPRSVSNWVRRPRSIKATSGRSSSVSHGSLSKEDVTVPQRTQAVNVYSQPEEYSSAVYYNQPFLYNMNEKALPVVSWTQNPPQQPHEELDYFAPIADPVNIPVGF